MIASAMTPAIPAPMAKTARSRSSAIPSDDDARHEGQQEHRQPVAESLDEDRPDTARRGIRNASPARMARVMSPRRAGRIVFAVKPIIS